MALTAAAFGIASVVHFGVEIPIGAATISDSFPGAAPPEALIAAVMAIGATAVLRQRPNSRKVALGTATFALLVALYGLKVTLNSSRAGDVAYHLSIVAALVSTLGLLLMPGRLDVRPDSGDRA